MIKKDIKLMPPYKLLKFLIDIAKLVLPKDVNISNVPNKDASDNAPVIVFSNDQENN